MRRAPPPFRTVELVRKETVSPLMTRLIFHGDDLAGFPVPDPGASVRLLIPDDDELVIPTWQGNEFRYDDGRRPTIRTFTPRRFDADGLLLDIDVVLHDGGTVSRWATQSGPGAAAAISGPGRGYEIDPRAERYVLIGDETAIPAICQMLEHLGDVEIVVHIDIRSSSARVDLHRDVGEHWHIHGSVHEIGGAAIEALDGLEFSGGDRIWAAGEAGAMQRLRRYLFEQRGVDRSQTSVRGYWKDR